MENEHGGTSLTEGVGVSVSVHAPERSHDEIYRWRVGDVFVNGPYRWQVDSIRGDKAVMRSCGSSWATTIPLTFDEWREGGRWQLEA